MRQGRIGLFCRTVLPMARLFFLLVGIAERTVGVVKRKAMIMDEAAVGRAMARITHEIIERNRGAEEICLLGVKRRGIPLAAVLAENIKNKRKR